MVKNLISIKKKNESHPNCTHPNCLEFDFFPTFLKVETLKENRNFSYHIILTPFLMKVKKNQFVFLGKSFPVLIQFSRS